MAAPEQLLLPAPRGPLRPPGARPRLTPPYFIVAVSLLEVMVFACGDSRVESTLLYDPHHRSQLWRYVTYMLLHGGWLHLGLNVAIQCFLAAPVEHEQGHWRAALVYLGGGIAGSLGTSVLEPKLYIVGASAGVYALLISQLANIILNYHSLRYKAYRAVAVLVLAVTDVGFLLYHHYSFGNVCPRIGWAAHCSGAVAGLFIGLVVFHGEPHKPPANWIRAVSWCAMAILSAAFIAVVVCNILQPTSSLVPPQRRLVVAHAL